MSKEAVSDSALDAVAKKRRILVVDGSRVVRTTLAKRLEENFSIVEEDNGESAWQRLMLDNSIAAVVSSPNPPRLTALDLLERMRTSALRRLRETPMVLLVSDDNPETDADEWQRQGIAGVMSKSMSKGVMAEHLEDVLSTPSRTTHPESTFELQDEEPPGETQAPPERAQEETYREEAQGKSRAGRARSSASLLDAEVFAAALASLPHEMSSDESLCVLVFGIDRLSELISRFGADVPDLLTGRIAKLLAAKIDPRDVLGRCGEECADVAIVSHGTDLRSGVHFGRRVCRSLAAGQIAVHGRKIRLTTSVGVAATPDDRASSPEELLALAQERMKQAMLCGGNAVCTELHPDCPLIQRDKALLGLFGLLGEVLEPEQKEALGMAVRPLLGKIDARLANEARAALDLPPVDDEEDSQDEQEEEKS
jgi:diguanylate cyclase (GGDEF)-like protein